MNRFLCIALLLLTSCGYRFSTCPKGTVCVPFAQGDKEGLFTSALIEQVVAHGHLKYDACNPDYIINVCLGPPRSTNVGFTYAPGKKFLVSNEARLAMNAKVTVVEAATGRNVFGPCALSSFLHFDFEPDLSNIQEHAFALGQSEMFPLAKMVAMRPLYHRLAEKIVDSLANCW